jgi:hypothetical protein
MLGAYESANAAIAAAMQRELQQCRSSASLLSKTIVYLGFRARLAARFFDLAVCRHKVSARLLCNS